MFAYICHHRYHENLKKAKELGIKKAFVINLALGFDYMIMYLIYALAFWYGCGLVLKNELTIGSLMIVRPRVKANVHSSM